MTVRVVLLAGIMILSLNSRLLAQHNNLSLDKEHVVGSIEAHFSNLASWQSGDCLIRISVLSEGRHIEIVKQSGALDKVKAIDGPDSLSAIIESTSVHRVRFDFANQRVFIANRSSSRQQRFDALDQELGKPLLETDDRVIAIDREAKVGATRMEAAVIRRFEPGQIPSVERALDWYNVPNLKLIGLSGLTTWSGDSYQRRFDLMRNIDELEDVTNIGQDRYKLFFRHRMNPNDSRTGIRSYYDWDAARHLPLKVSAFSGYRPEDFPDATQPITSGMAKWTANNGCFLPIMARYARGRYGRVEGRRFRFQEETTIEIHWFSINREFPDEFFGEEILHDRKALDVLLDTGVLETDRPRRESVETVDDN